MSARRWRRMSRPSSRAAAPPYRYRWDAGPGPAPAPASLTLAIMKAMYVPAHFKPDDAEDPGVARLRSCREPDHRHGARTDREAIAPLVHDRPEARPGLGPWGAHSWATSLGTTPGGRCPRSARRWSSSPGQILTSPRRGKRSSVSTAGWFPPGTTSPRTRTVGWSSTTTRPGSRRMSGDSASTTRARESIPWSVDDAPEAYIAGQLKAIVGVEIVIDRVEGKWKLSQNRSEADIAGTIEGLEFDGRARGLRRDARVGSPPLRTVEPDLGLGGRDSLRHLFASQGDGRLDPRLAERRGLADAHLDVAGDAKEGQRERRAGDQGPRWSHPDR